MAENRMKVVGGNWKMNLSQKEANDLAVALSKHHVTDANTTVIVFPSFTYITSVDERIKNSSVKLGAQNCSDKVKGAFTGEVSAAQLSSCGVKYCLVGHSERRQYFAESSNVLIEKIKRCLEEKIIPVFCIGEKLEERKDERHFAVVEHQLKEVLVAFTSEQVNGMFIAYEPVWAIGTGETATPQQAQEMHKHIRTALEVLKGKDVASKMPLMYGGSCNAQNAKELFSQPDVDGGLIGGASLKADEFIQIINSF